MVDTSGAFVSRDHGDALPIIRVGDTNRLSAKIIATAVILVRTFDE